VERIRIATPFKTKYINEVGLLIDKARYNDGSTALILKSAFGEQVAIATVSLAENGEKPDEGNVFIKNWSENEGVFDALHKCGVIGKCVRRVPVANVDALECELLK
jgi:uncharacterized protein (DUF2147 family)